MINNKWMENPVLSDISTEKMEVLTKILNGAGDMDAKQMLTYFIKETNQASKNEEIKRIDTIKRMVSMLGKRKKMN